MRHHRFVFCPKMSRPIKLLQSVVLIRVLQMALFANSIPAPIFDSDESDVGSQQSNDSSSYLSTQFHQHTRLSFSPKISCRATSQVLPRLSSIFDDDEFSRSSSEISWQSSSHFSLSSSKVKRQRTEEISLRTPYTRRENLHCVQENHFSSTKSQRRIRYSDHSISIPTDLVNLNPFSPQSMISTHRYHTRLVAKRESNMTPALRQLIIPRFEQEFHQQSFLAQGRFNDVRLCSNRLDGLTYAIKSSKQSILNTREEQWIWREICAYAVLINHEHLIRYYSAWIEPDGRFFIQLEFSSGGSLEDLIVKNRQEDLLLSDQDLRILLHQMSDVLTFIHGHDLVHCNIKPENILLASNSNDEIIYKLTDFNHVHQINSVPLKNNEDRRYLPLEMFENQLINDKCDIFSLGLTLYVAASNCQLPVDGHSWEEFRSNIQRHLPSLTHCSSELNDLLFNKIFHLDRNQRPSARDLLLNRMIHPSTPTSRDYLQQRLKEEREKNSLLHKKLLDQYLPSSTEKSSTSNMFRYYSSMI